MSKLMILGTVLMIPVAGVAAAAAWRRSHANADYDDELPGPSDDPRFSYDVPTANSN